jgi:hypothetical protein
MLAGPLPAVLPRGLTTLIVSKNSLSGEHAKSMWQYASVTLQCGLYVVHEAGTTCLYWLQQPDDSRTFIHPPTYSGTAQRNLQIFMASALRNFPWISNAASMMA